MNNKDQEHEAPTGPLIFTLPASSFIVVLGLDRLNGIFRSTLVPAFAKDSLLAGVPRILLETIVATVNLRSSAVSLKTNGRLVKWTSNRFTFCASDLLKLHLTGTNSGVRAANQLN